MGIEAGAYKDQEEKKKKIEKKESVKSKIDKKDKELKDKNLREHIKAEEAISNMRDMINDKDLDLSLEQVQMIEKVISGEEISNDVIEDILEKIEDTESIKDIDKYLPKELRITGEEYKRAIRDDVFRVQMITKIDTALTILSDQAVPDSSMGLNLFSGYMAVLDKTLIKIQENHIDIKDSLKEVEEKKNPKPKLAFWKKFILLLKEIFS